MLFWPLLSTHLLVVLLEVDQLLPQALDLHLQVGADHGQLVQNLSEAADVSLDRLAHGELVLIPDHVNEILSEHSTLAITLYCVLASSERYIFKSYMNNL